MKMTIQEQYIKEVAPALKKRFGYSNIKAVPKIEKVVVNVKAGRLKDDKEHQEVQKFLSVLTGQKPSPRPAKKAMASFKTRKGSIIGYQVTLRGPRMYDFLARLIHIVLPRMRDFRGVDEAFFDAHGNLTLGVKEHIVFPEMIGEDYRFLFGLGITIVTTAHTRPEGIELLRLLGLPLKKKEDKN